jgi:alpha-N-acetylglucosaminidase
MAMNGVNRPLMVAGQEAVWLDVWKSFGLSEEQIRKYFTGPAHLPWHWMSNIESVDGPLPMSYIEGWRDLQTTLLREARVLGMEPILPGFAGRVPEALREVKPDEPITRIRPGWGGFGPDAACWFLDPASPLFSEIQKRFLTRQAEMYGTDHRYAADPFNEIQPPSWSPDYMGGVAKGIYDSLSQLDPDTVWYQKGWTFYYVRKNWAKADEQGRTPLQAMIAAVPTGKMVLLDYVCENIECFRTFNNFEGAPFIWNCVGNFGGNTYMRAQLDLISNRIAKALEVPNCIGVGATLEGLNVNPVVYDMILEQPWHPGGVIEDSEWIRDYAARRAGRRDPKVGQAWSLVLERVLNPGKKDHFDRGSAITQPPPRWTTPDGPPPPETALVGKNTRRDPALARHLLEAVDHLLAADPASLASDGVRYDVVNFTRQMLAYHSDAVRERLDRAYDAKDEAEMARQTAGMLKIIRDIDRLVGTRREFLLGTWLRDARAWGRDEAEADDYEGNARRIITVWGGRLNDYAHREWNGLLRDYYYPRWWRWARTHVPAAVAGQTDPGPAGDFTRLRAGDYATEPVGDPLDTAREILRTYRTEIMN